VNVSLLLRKSKDCSPEMDFAMGVVLVLTCWGGVASREEPDSRGVAEAESRAEVDCQLLRRRCCDFV
jgi:hypothetical protein